MLTREQVWNEVNALPHAYIFYTRKEVNYLPKILTEGEHILAVTSGLMDNRTWLAVCTNRRVLFLDRGMFYGLRQVQINLDRLQTIESDSGFIFGSIRVVDSGSAMTVRMVLKSSIAPFVRTVQDAMDHYKRQMVYDVVKQSGQVLSHAQASVSNTPTHPDLTSELERLAALQKSGHLTPEEFAIAKAKLLGH